MTHKDGLWVVIYYQEGAYRDAFSGAMMLPDAVAYLTGLAALPDTIRVSLERARPVGTRG